MPEGNDDNIGLIWADHSRKDPYFPHIMWLDVQQRFTYKATFFKIKTKNELNYGCLTGGG